MLEKPPKLNAIGTTILIGGVWSVFGSICLTYFTGFLCLPITVFWFASGVHNILKGLQMSRKDETGEGFTKRCAYLLIAQIFTLDVLGACLGGFVLLLLDDPQVRAYYEQVRASDRTTPPKAQHTPAPIVSPSPSVVHAPADPFPKEPLPSVVWSTETPTPSMSQEDVSSPLPAPEAPDQQSGYKVATWSAEPTASSKQENAPMWETVSNSRSVKGG